MSHDLSYLRDPPYRLSDTDILKRVVLYRPHMGNSAKTTVMIFKDPVEAAPASAKELVDLLADRGGIGAFKKGQKDKDIVEERLARAVAKSKDDGLKGILDAHVYKGA